MKSVLSIISGAAFALSIGLAQEEKVLPGPTAAEVQEKVREWVRVQEIISEEESQWREERQLLGDLNELRQREIEKLDETIQAAGERVEDFQKKRDELDAEETELRQDRQTLLARIEPLEVRARELLKSFPRPLRDKVGDAADRLENPDPELPLQNRYRDVLAVLIEGGNFDDKITLHTELRELDGKELELQVLYLGLGRAYYVGRNGRHAGIGVPGPDGWTWTEEPGLAAEIRQTIAIHQQEAPPAFVRLPVQVQD